jgi:hypothetical protein
MYVSPFGKEEGLSKRLDKWATDLSRQQTYPWVGLGLIADLRAAAAVIDGRPIPVDPNEGLPEDTEPAPSSPEYDL